MKSEIYVIGYRLRVRFSLQSSRLVTDSRLGQVHVCFYVNFFRMLFTQAVSLGLVFGFFFCLFVFCLFVCCFSAFSHKSPSGLYSACVTANACLRHITEVVVV